MVETKYVLDANVFIQAYRTYYPFDVAPKFWEILEDEKIGVCSIDKVRDEIKNDDELSIWMKDKFSKKVKKVNSLNVTKEYSRIISWSQSQDYTDAAKYEFAKVADGWLVAYGLAENLTVVTQEKKGGNMKNRIKIPDVCEKFNVKYIDTIQLLRDLNVRFI